MDENELQDSLHIVYFTYSDSTSTLGPKEEENDESGKKMQFDFQYGLLLVVLELEDPGERH